MAGSKDGGKLGLGPSTMEGILLNFLPIPNITGIKFLACGPNHMLSIQNRVPETFGLSHSKFDGSTYAWGFN